MNLNAYRNELNKLRVCKTVPESMRSRLVMLFFGVSNSLELAKDEVLFEEGAPRDEVGYVLIRGEVAIQKGDMPPARVSAPELLGEMSLFNPAEQRTATVRAGVDAEVLKFSWKTFSSFANRLFDPGEQSKLTAALEECAWEHFIE